MPLIDRNGASADPWTREASHDAQQLIVPLEQLSEALASRRNDQRLGVSVANIAIVADLAHYLDRVELIAIAFPAYSDGRGFTLAKRLRREGFTGKLRAEGPLIADQLAYALACGFDEIEIPEALANRQPVSHWLKAAQSFSATYQRGYEHKGSILDQRRIAAASPARAGS